SNAGHIVPLFVQIFNRFRPDPPMTIFGIGQPESVHFVFSSVNSSVGEPGKLRHFVQCQSLSHCQTSNKKPAIGRFRYFDMMSGWTEKCSVSRPISYRLLFPSTPTLIQARSAGLDGRPLRLFR